MVIHDDEGSMQFLDGEDITEEDAATVALSEVIDSDPTLVQVACLPIGFGATRESVGGPWQLFLAGHPDDDSPDTDE